MKGKREYPLELSPEQMMELVDAAMKRLVAHARSEPRRPASDMDGASDLARSLKEPLPRTGVPSEELLDLLFQELLPKGVDTGGAGYFGYMGGGGLFHAAVAALVANAVNRVVSQWFAAPPLAQIEANVIRWFAEIVGFPSDAGGILTSGCSIAHLTAIVTARVARLPPDFLKGTLYVSDQAHHSVEKAAIIAGIPRANVRSVPTDESFRMRPEALRDAIVRDRFEGREPFLVVATAGTTNTGAVDDLERVGEVARLEGLWFHVDAAYGGFFMLTERGRIALRGMSRADSVALDPHKSLFMPYGTGSLLVKDRESLRRAHVGQGEYLPPLQESDERVDFSALGPELSRDFRGLRVWLPLKMHGSEAFRALLDEKLDLVRWATEQLRGMDGVEIVTEPQLSVVTFRWSSAGLTAEAEDQRNRELLERVNAKKRVFLVGTTLRQRFVLRMCVLSFRLHQERVAMALEDLREAMSSLRT